MSRLAPLLLSPLLLLLAQHALAAAGPIGQNHAEQAAVQEPAPHAAHGAMPDVAPDHVRWQPDEPLRQGMRRMHAVVEVLGHGEHGHVDRSQFPRLTREVEAAAADMFARCSLEPEPDAALHGILARLLGSARALRENPSDPAPIAQMRAAVADYPRLFDDPSFPAIAHAGG